MLAPFDLPSGDVTSRARAGRYFLYLLLRSRRNFRLVNKVSGTACRRGGGGEKRSFTRIVKVALLKSFNESVRARYVDGLKKILLATTRV